MLFALISSILFFLLVLFADASYGSYILFLVSLFLLLSSPKLLSKKRVSDFFSKWYFKVLFIILLIFLSLASFSLFYTINVPFSIDRLSKLFFSFLIFFFFLFVKEEYLNKNTIFFFINILFLTLSFLVLFFMIFPKLGDSLPGMNLLFTSYGHNHFAALLLLLIPLFFLQFMEKQNNFNFTLIILSYLLVALSFARVVIFLSILEFFVLFLISRNNLSSLKNKQKKRLLSMIFILLILLILMLVFSFSSLNLFCNTDLNLLCKDFSNEGRFSYWVNAVSIFKDNFLLGTGLNTYVLESKKYFHFGDSITSYAHNEFLQIFSDLGLFGGISFLFLFLSMFFITLNSVKKSKYKKYMFVAICFILIDVLVDFDWQFVSIFTLTLIYFAFIFREKSENDKISSKTNRFYIFYYLILFLVLINGFLASLSAFFLNKNKNLAFDIYPYSIFYKNDFLEGEILSSDRVKRLEYIYRNDPFFIIRSTANKESSEVIDLFSEAIGKYPLIVSFSDFKGLVDDNLNKENYIEMSQLLFSVVDYLDNELINGYEMADELKELVGSSLLRISKYAFQEKDWVLLGQVYYKYSRLFINLPESFEPLFLEEKPDSAFYELLFSMEEFNPHLYFNNSEKFKEFYLGVAASLIDEADYQKGLLLYQRMAPFTDGFVWSGDISDHILLDLLNTESADELAKKMSVFIEFFWDNESFFWNYFFKRDLSIKLIDLADKYYAENSNLSFKYYVYSHALDKWNLSKESNVFSNLDFFALNNNSAEYSFFIDYFKNQLENNPNLRSQIGENFYLFLIQN